MARMLACLNISHFGSLQLHGSVFAYRCIGVCVSACVSTKLCIGGRMAAVAGGVERRPHMGSRPTIDTHSISACINTFRPCCQLLSNRVKCAGLEERKSHQKNSLHLIIDGKHYVSRCSVCCVSVCVFICMCDVLYVKHLAYLFAPASYGLFLKYTRRSIYVIRGHSVVNNTLKHTL